MNDQDGCISMHEHHNIERDMRSFMRPLFIALSITATFTFIEFLGGLLSGSLALLSDAGHMLMDSLALALSLMALRIAFRPPTEKKTFGFSRAEILAALLNSSTLIVLSLLIIYEAILRFLEPPKIDAPLMLIVAVAGLCANGAGIYFLHDTSKTNLNVKGAFLHIVGDLLSSVAVIIGAIMIYFFDVNAIDPILSILIACLILYGAIRLLFQSTNILLESTPSHLELDTVRRNILEIDGIIDVHDLHIWTVSSGLYSLSAHLVINDRMISDCSSIVKVCQGILKMKFAITHTTFQLECDKCPENSCVFDSLGETR